MGTSVKGWEYRGFGIHRVFGQKIAEIVLKKTSNRLFVFLSDSKFVILRTFF